MDNIWIIGIGFMAILLYHAVRWYLGMEPDMPSSDSDDSHVYVDSSDSSDGGGD